MEGNEMRACARLMYCCTTGLLLFTLIVPARAEDVPAGRVLGEPDKPAAKTASLKKPAPPPPTQEPALAALKAALEAANARAKRTESRLGRLETEAAKARSDIRSNAQAAQKAQETASALGKRVEKTESWQQTFYDTDGNFNTLAKRVSGQRTDFESLAKRVNQSFTWTVAIGISAFLALLPLLFACLKWLVRLIPERLEPLPEPNPLPEPASAPAPQYVVDPPNAGLDLGQVRADTRGLGH